MHFITKLKFDGTMDADAGFETRFFVTYGKERLRDYLNGSSHELKEKIEKKIFAHESDYSDKSGRRYQVGQIAFFLKKTN
jgi:hypothetical protein